MPMGLEGIRIGLERLRGKNLDRWAAGYIRWLARTAIPRAMAEMSFAPRPRHLLFAFCDHFEPLWKTTDRDRGAERVRAWTEGYPLLAKSFRDADGRPPRHSFFFPGEEYGPDYLDGLAGLCRQGLGEVELHLHHDGDTAENLRSKIDEYLGIFAKHGHLSRDADGRLRYAFIHGNWCLANARSDGRWCGVNEELPLLFQTGCYADFTFPSAPDESQPAIVNQIYWPEGDLARRRAYDGGTPARVGTFRRDRILMVPGPLAVALRPGALPRIRIENAAITAADPPTRHRIRSWVRQAIGVEGRPDWVFVKVHTHGAPEKQAAALLGDAGNVLHAELASGYNDGKNWRLHYVTAREMFNVAVAAMEGRDGDPNEYRDHVLSTPPIAG